MTDEQHYEYARDILPRPDPAGRTLDERVAIGMGWRLCRWLEQYDALPERVKTDYVRGEEVEWLIEPNGVRPVVPDGMGLWRGRMDVPKYSTDWQAFGELVAWLQANEWQFAAESPDETCSEWFSNVIKSRSPFHECAYGATLPEAVCRAFVAACEAINERR